MKYIKQLLLLTFLLTLTLNAREEVNIKFDKLQISAFIKLVAKLSNKNILVTNKINGTFYVVKSTPIYDVELLVIILCGL